MGKCGCSKWMRTKEPEIHASMPKDYWTGRDSLEYYQLALAYLRKYVPQPGRLLDVGGGIQYGARYLDWLPEWDRTSVEKPHNDTESPAGIRLVKSDFMDWRPDEPYDAVICLQVLEHVEDPAAFAAKIFSCASRLVVISVPFKWRSGSAHGHIHDPIDRDKLARWLGRERTESKVVDRRPFRRLVSAYKLD